MTPESTAPVTPEVRAALPSWAAFGLPPIVWAAMRLVSALEMPVEVIFWVTLVPFFARLAAAFS